jgi:hypothetical protein
MLCITCELSWVDVVTDGQSAYPSWCRAPLWGPWPDFFFTFFCWTIALLLVLGRHLWREDRSAICSVITQCSESLRIRNHTLLSHLRLPQPGGPGSSMYSLQEQDGPIQSQFIVIQSHSHSQSQTQSQSQSQSQSKPKLRYDWWSVSQYVVVSSPLWDLWPDIAFCPRVAVFSLWGAVSDERTDLLFFSLSL